MPGGRGCEARPEGGALRSPCSSAASASYLRQVTPPQATVNANSLVGFLFWTLRPLPLFGWRKTPPALRRARLPENSCPPGSLPLLPRLAEPASRRLPNFILFHLFHCCSPKLPALCRGRHRMASGNFGDSTASAPHPPTWRDV